MLQNVRDNMKGTIATIVVIIFVVPMVVTGIGGSSFLSSIAGTDAAKVNRQAITRTELNRAVFQQRERMKSQGVDAASDQLKDENLVGPVLQSLVRQAALVTTSKKAGMGISDKQIFSAIQEAPGFQVDGVFNRDIYRQQISLQGHSPTTFKEYVGDILLIQQGIGGLSSSAFVTDAEVNAMIAIAQEKRSFSLIDIPSKDLGKDIEVTEEEIQAYYEQNQNEFAEPEKMSISYLELSVEQLMENVSVSENDIKQRYEDEKKEYLEQGQNIDVQIAHLMLKKRDDGSHEQTLALIQERLQAGESFAELVKEFSEDEGSRANGGDLGVLTKESFYSEEFQAVARALDEGAVSAPVEMNGNIHLIKSLAKSVAAFPSFEEQKLSIETQLKRAKAEELYAGMEQDFEDMTFSAENLTLASEALNLTIQESELFQRNSGTGIASNPAIREAAWREEVLLDGRNSPKIQIGPGHAVVVRQKEHVLEHIRPLEEVQASIVEKLNAEKLAEIMNAKAQALIAALKEGADAKTLSENNGYTFNAYENVKRFEAPVDFQVRNAVFNLPKAEELVYENVAKANGDSVVIVLSNVVKGQRSDMPEQQIDVLSSQLLRENTLVELSAYQEKIVENSKIKYFIE